MTALAADQPRDVILCQKREFLPASGVAASSKGYVGSGMVFNASGYLEPATTATGKTSAGVLPVAYDNSSGANGAVKVSVMRGQFWFANDGSDPVVQADMFQSCYWKDDNTVCHTSTGKSVAGKVMLIDSSLGVLVEFG